MSSPYGPAHRPAIVVARDRRLPLGLQCAVAAALGATIGFLLVSVLGTWDMQVINEMSGWEALFASAYFYGIPTGLPVGLAVGLLGFAFGKGVVQLLTLLGLRSARRLRTAYAVGNALATLPFWIVVSMVGFGLIGALWPVLAVAALLAFGLAFAAQPFFASIVRRPDDGGDPLRVP